MNEVEQSESTVLEDKKRSPLEPPSEAEVAAEKKACENRRAELKDENSVGYRLVHVLREQKLGTGKDKQKTATGKKKASKAVATNLRLKKNDLALLDAMAEFFGVSRSFILEGLVTHDIGQMFEALTPYDALNMAEIVDAEIEKKGFENEYRGQTWYWDVVQPDWHVRDPEQKGIFKSKLGEV